MAFMNWSKIIQQALFVGIGVSILDFLVDHFFHLFGAQSIWDYVWFGFWAGVGVLLVQVIFPNRTKSLK